MNQHTPGAQEQLHPGSSGSLFISFLERSPLPDKRADTDGHCPAVLFAQPLNELLPPALQALKHSRAVRRPTLTGGHDQLNDPLPVRDQFVPKGSILPELRQETTNSGRTLGIPRLCAAARHHMQQVQRLHPGQPRLHKRLTAGVQPMDGSTLQQLQQQTLLVHSRGHRLHWYGMNRRRLQRLIQTLLQLQQHLLEVARHHVRLDNVIRYAVPDRFLGILEILQVAQDKDFQVRGQLAHLGNQFNAVHDGHFDIGNQNVGQPGGGHQLQRFPAVPGLPGDLHPDGFPFNHRPDPISHDKFIFYDNDPVHISGSPLCHL